VKQYTSPVPMNIFDILTLSDFVSLNNQQVFANQAGDISDDGQINFVDVISLATLIPRGDI
tara:strand:+ start:1059 stop:1241 length:183 start_codon:yes stop_codon:yes gene_type:complete